ncbi:MAG: SNF2-related protein, partial [Kocuria sp.]|nr:SNF2-related protein [Kocuria sp.]
MTVDVEFRNGLLRLHNVAGDHLGFTQALPLSRRRKDRGATFWEASTSDAASVVSWADSKNLVVADDVRAHASSLWKRESQKLAIATAIDLGTRTPPEIVGLESDLLDTQSVLVSASTDAWFAPPGNEKLRHRAILLADDQGLGKTLTALAILRVKGHEIPRAVVVCPTSLTENWRNETYEHFTDGTFTTWTATGKTPSAIPDGTDVVVIGWDILADWEDVLIEWAPQALIADEGHYAKSGKQQKRTTREPKRDDNGHIVYGPDGLAVMEKVTKVVGGSARATAIINIGKSVSKNHGLIMPMTGTPIVNRPLEMLALIELCGIEKLFVSAHEFKERYCGPTWKTVK